MADNENPAVKLNEPGGVATEDWVAVLATKLEALKESCGDVDAALEPTADAERLAVRLGDPEKDESWAEADGASEPAAASEGLVVALIDPGGEAPRDDGVAEFETGLEARG